MEYLNEVLKTLRGLGPEAFCVLSCIAFGYVIRFIPAISNRWIPAICIVFAPVVYPFLTSTSRVTPEAQEPAVRIILTGLILGVGAWVLHDKVLAHIEHKIPGLGKLLTRADAAESKRYRKAEDGSFEEIKDDGKGA